VTVFAYIALSSMSRSLKLIALLLIMAIGVVPVLAAAGPCFEQAEPGMHCPPGCPMVAMHKAAPGTQFESQSPAQSCCNLHSGKQAPSAEVQIPSATASLEPPFSSVALMPTAEFGINDESPLQSPHLAWHQALLCTFLI
jgi:hypothetical protein